MLSEELPGLLDDLHQRLYEVERLNALDVPEPMYRSLIAQMSAIRDRSERIGLGLAVQGIRNGDLSRRAAADRLRIHPNTLERWIVRLESLYTSGNSNPLSTINLDN